MTEQNHTEEEFVRLPTAELLGALPYRLVLFNLFLHPKYGLFLTLRQASWWRALLVLLLLGSVGSCLKTMNEMPGLVSKSRKISMFLSDNLGDLRFQDGKIAWTQTPEYPLTGYFDRFRVDVHTDLTAVRRGGLVNSRANAGLILTPRQMDLWMSAGQPDGEVRTLTILTPKIIAGFEKNQSKGTLPAVFTREVLLDYVQVWCLVLLLPTLLFSYWFSMLASVVLFALFFALAVQFRRRAMGRNFSLSLSMGLHCCIAPFFTALVYEVFVPSLGSFDNIFVIIFVLYIIYMQVEDRWFRESQKHLWKI